MGDQSSTSDYADRWGLGFGKPDSDRRKALEDPETGEPHQYRLSDATIGRRNSEVALELLRIYSHQGRVFLTPDAAGIYALAINAVTMSKDAIALFDGIREGSITLRAVGELVKGLEAAATSQREDVVKRAEAEAQADADAYPGRKAPGSGVADRIKQ
jgi:hypothetical protein